VLGTIARTNGGTSGYTCVDLVSVTRAIRPPGDRAGTWSRHGVACWRDGGW